MSVGGGGVGVGGRSDGGDGGYGGGNSGADGGGGAGGGGVDVFDVLIVGGGLVGGSLAVALAAGGRRCAVVEAVDWDDRAAAAADANATTAASHTTDNTNATPADTRTIALTDNARRIYTALGLWHEIQAGHAEPIRDIHISDRGHFGMTHLSHRDAGVAALGYVVPSAVLGAVLRRRMRDDRAITLIAPARVTGLRPGADEVEVSVSGGGGDVSDDGGDGGSTSTNAGANTNHTLRARLVVLADGGDSDLAAQFGITARRHDYRVSAILCLINTDRDHHGRAYERFTADGPLALLPHSTRRYAVVWSTAQARVAARMALADDAFTAELQATFGERAGRFAKPTPRACQPLLRARVRNPTAPRLLALGNAAHRVHPVAGQGFNLALRDVAVLAELLATTRADGGSGGSDLGTVGETNGGTSTNVGTSTSTNAGNDPGDPTLLARYTALRRRETLMVSGFTDGLIRVFTSRHLPVRCARNLALAGIELLPPAKRFLLRRTMGLAGTRSRLGAGLPLTPLSDET